MDGCPESEVIVIQPKSSCWRYFSWLRLVCVEPTMWLYMMAFMTTTIVELEFFYHKACRVDNGFSKEICDTIKDNESLNTQFLKVQLTYSEFTQWNNIFGHVVPIILALFYGNWSDRYGRKLPLLIGLSGKLIYSMMIVVNTIMEDWNLNMVIWTATVPMGMLGGDVAIFASAFAYISDVSSLEHRTLRITILDAVYLSAMPLGAFIGKFIFNHVAHKSFTILFIINCSFLILAILYSLVNLKWQTSERQSRISGPKAIMNFFDKKHAVATAKTVTKPRHNHGRLYLWIIFVAMLFYTFQRDEKQFTFPYTKSLFKWGFTEISDFRIFQSVSFVLVMLVVAPLFSETLKMSDTVMVSIGALSHASGRIFYSSAKTPGIFYLGALVASLGPIVAPSLRSMISKLVNAEERGKVFALLSVCDNAVPLFSGFLYNQLYTATITTRPYAIYWLTFATQIIVLLLILVIHFSSISAQFNPDDYTVQDESPSNPTNVSGNDGSEKEANFHNS